MDNVWISTISQKIQSKSKASDVQPGKIVGGVKKQEKITAIYLEASKIKRTDKCTTKTQKNYLKKF